ncbi:uncharacterized protein [Chaetodon trifascialis]|uniref:uncharacterized protein n=1 Tax=Chaetodon trifascialis TaxID=109706 RepID=UPI003995ED55
MRSFTLLTVLLLCTLSWISVSGSEAQTVEVQPGEEVTLMCSNKSVHPAQTDWFRLTDRSKPHCISSMYMSDGEASFCDGIKKGKFQMSSNGSTVFLQIQRVDSSDSGLYFCGFYMDGHTVIVSATHLNIQDDSEGISKLMSVILGALTVFLVMVIVALVVKSRKRQNAGEEEQSPEQRENVGSDELNYAAVTFRPKAKRRELEPNVIYASTR